MGCTTHLEEIDAGYREDKVSVPEFSLRDPAKTQVSYICTSEHVYHVFGSFKTKNV